MPPHLYRAPQCRRLGWYEKKSKQINFISGWPWVMVSKLLLFHYFSEPKMIHVQALFCGTHKLRKQKQAHAS